MAKLVLDDLANLENVVSLAAIINSNNAKIEAAMEKTLSRDGTEPNEMEADLDMNSQRIFNLVPAVSDTEPVRLREFNSALGSVAEVADFDIRYLGPKTSAPATDNDGNPLQVGALYFQSTGLSVGMYVWDGDSWEIAFASVTAGTVSFTPTVDITSTNVQAAIEEVYTLLSASPSVVQAVFNSRTDLAAATVDASVNSVIVLAHSVTGDGGVGIMTRSVSASPYTGATTQDAGGTYWVYDPVDNVNPRFFGAKGDAVTDDRAAFQNAIDFAQAFGIEVLVPPGGYNLPSTIYDGANYYALKLNGLAPFRGTNMQSTVFFAQDQFNATNIFHITPANATCSGFRMSDFAIVGGLTSPRRQGLHGIYIDTRVAGKGLAKPIFERLNIEQGYIDFIDTGVPQAGRAIYHDNNQANNPNGGVFGMIIRDCRNLGGGVRLYQTGDQNMIINNIFTGENNSAISYKSVGLHATLCGTDGGAGFITFRDSTIVNKGGMIIFDRAVNGIVDGVYGECFGAGVGIPYTRPELTTGGCIVYIDSADATIAQLTITNCRFAVQTGVSTGVTSNIYVGNAMNVIIGEGNTHYAASGTSYGVEFSSASHDCTAYDARFVSFAGSGFRVRDSGTRNRYNDFTGVTLLNGFTENLSGYNPAYVYRDDQNMIRLSGLLNHAGASSVIIYTLPVNWRPAYHKRFPVYANNGSSNVAGSVDVLSTGNVIYVGPTATQISLDGVSFVKDDPVI